MDIPLTIYIPTKTTSNSNSRPDEQEDWMAPPSFERWSSDCSNPSSRGCAANPPTRPQRNMDNKSLGDLIGDDDDDDDAPCNCLKDKSSSTLDTAPRKPQRCCESSPDLCTGEHQGLSLQNAFCLSRGIPLKTVTPTWSMHTTNTKWRQRFVVLVHRMENESASFALVSMTRLQNFMTLAYNGSASVCRWRCRLPMATSKRAATACLLIPMWPMIQGHESTIPLLPPRTRLQ